MLYGRDDESLQIERMLAEARKAGSSALVLAGEPGIGKTTLLAHTRDRARGFQVLAATGVSSERAVSFAGLDQILGSVRDSFDDIPPPQARALRAALDLSSSSRLDRDAVLRGTHSVLTALAADKPVLCTVDDSDLLDTGSLAALAFAARRLGTERIAMVFARRDTAEIATLDGLPTLELRGLDLEEARALLDARRPGVVAPGVVERLVASTGGNPLALLQAPDVLTDAQLAGRAPLEYPIPVGERIVEAFATRANRLSKDARAALVTAAAADTQTMRVLTEDGAIPEITREALDECEAGEFFAIRKGLLVFPHPLARAAVYRAASPSAQRDAHRRLAAASTGDRRALHLAAAAAGPDEDAAAELERAGLRSLRRSGYATAAAWLEQAAELTPDGADRARRMALAAVTASVAGAPLRARELAAAGLEAADEPAVRDALGGVGALLDSAERTAADAGPFLTGGLTLLGLEPAEEPEALVRVADERFETHADEGALQTAVDAAVAAAREREAEWFLPRALVHRARLHIQAGSWAEAEADALEAKALADRLGDVRSRADACVLRAGIEARRGRVHDCVELLDEFVALADTGGARAVRAGVLGLLDLGVGRINEAIDELEAAGALSRDAERRAALTVGTDLVEALVRAGRDADAGADGAHHAAWRRALLTGDADAFEEALADPALSPFDRARIELSRGERLRRAGERSAARENLRAAHELFEGLGADPWAARTRDELAATGETARRRDPSTVDQLTPQELRVLNAVAAGASMKEAAQTLFLSPRTVEFHLGKVYRKLGVHSRKELAVTLERLRAEGVDLVGG
jgi:DNA-binding CsgD family transcriptional regulator